MLMRADSPSGTDEIPGVAEQLIEQICTSDEMALATLFDMFADRVYALALPIVGCAGLVEEVCSDVFTQVWLKADRFDPARGNAESWIMMMARSRSLDRLRKEARHRSGLPHPFDDTVAYSDQSLEEPSGQFESDVTASAVRHSLAALNDGQQRVIRMAFFRGLSHQEIATRLGVPLGTVKSHCRRGLARMRSALMHYHPKNS